MPVAKTRSVLSGMRVREAMRRQMVTAGAAETARRGIARMIKYKSDTLLISDPRGRSLGLVSKTDMTGAFYAGLSVETALGDIMAGPLITCYPDDPLEDALETMARHQVHQLFVRGGEADRLAGLLTYGDMLGLVYRYCRHCRQSRFRPGPDEPATAMPPEARVEEVMTPGVIGCTARQSLIEVAEVLTAQRKSALLISDGEATPLGVISKSDLVMAWYRGVPADAPAARAMSAPVRACPRDATLTEAVARMLVEDIGRIFVQAPGTGQMVGVISLGDAVNHRSGTCRACVSTRLLG